ncbi:MFS transporter [Fluviispira vulneris]|uniref:MFS transporter n=1 Tax=Fluviispira vulneris TaxID=2763012 RepID=UPI001644B401|nr:MFS transporter [Fluviispira vulneris]
MKINHFLLMIFLMGCALFVVGQLYVPISLNSNISTQFNVTASESMLVSSVFGLSYAAGFLVLGSLSDKYGRRTVLVSGLSILALMTFVISLSSSFTFLLIARAFQGFVASSFPPAALSLVSETLECNKRPLGISLISLSFLASAPVIQLLSTWLDINFCKVMLLLVPIYLVGALGIFSFAPKTLSNLKKEKFVLRTQFFLLLKDSNILVSWFVATTVLFSFVAFHSGMQSLGKNLNVNLQYLRFAGLPTLLFVFWASSLIRKFGAFKTTLIGLVITILAFVIGLFNNSLNLLIASAVLTAGVSITTPSLIASISGRSSMQNRGLSLAIYSFMLFFGASVAPISSQYFAQFGLVILNIVPISYILIGFIIIYMAKKSDYKKISYHEA